MENEKKLTEEEIETVNGGFIFPPEKQTVTPTEVVEPYNNNDFFVKNCPKDENHAKIG